MMLILQTESINFHFELPELKEAVKKILYPERAAGLQDILNDKLDPALTEDLVNNCRFYIVG